MDIYSIATIILISVGAADNIAIITLPIVAVLLILGGVISALYLTREVVITTKRIICRFGLLTIRFWELPLNKIQSVMSTQTFWQKIANYGTLVISNSTFGITGYRFHGVVDIKITQTTLMCAIDNSENLKLKVSYQTNEESI